MPQVIEKETLDGLEYGVSFTDKNPGNEDYVACKTREDAEKLVKKLDTVKQDAVTAAQVASQPAIEEYPKWLYKKGVAPILVKDASQEPGDGWYGNQGLADAAADKPVEEPSAKAAAPITPVTQNNGFTTNPEQRATSPADSVQGTESGAAEIAQRNDEMNKALNSPQLHSRDAYTVDGTAGLEADIKASNAAQSDEGKDAAAEADASTERQDS